MGKNKLVFILSVIAGPLIGAFTFSSVIIPNKLMGGGLGGLSLLLSRLTGISMPIFLAAFFIPIAIWAFFQYGIRQILAALTGYVLFTAFMSFMPQIVPQIVTDGILAAIIAGLMLGVGGGVVLRLGIAHGPESLIGMSLKKKYNLPIGTFMTIFNASVLLASLFSADLTLVLYSAIAIYISGRVTNYIILGFGRYFEMSILTSKYLELTDFIHNSVKRGVTYIQCLGTYELKKQMMVKTLVKNDELIKIKNYLREIDPDCFIYINESAEVIGKGFQSV